MVVVAAIVGEKERACDVEEVERARSRRVLFDDSAELPLEETTAISVEQAVASDAIILSRTEVRHDAFALRPEVG